MSRPERTGWRDDFPSVHRRQFGTGFYNADVDEYWYYNKKAVAIVEYKHRRSRWASDDANVEALIDLADGYQSAIWPNGLSCFVIMFSPANLTWRVYPMNDVARRFVDPDKLKFDSERKLHYQLCNEADRIRLEGRVRIPAGLDPQRIEDAVKAVQKRLLPTCDSQTGQYEWTYTDFAYGQRPLAHRPSGGSGISGATIRVDWTDDGNLGYMLNNIADVQRKTAAMTQPYRDPTRKIANSKDMIMLARIEERLRRRFRTLDPEPPTAT